MDTSDPDISFDDTGICNHCREYEKKEASEVHYDYNGAIELSYIARQIKQEGKKKPFDCIIGLSGGLDSSYAALQVVKLLGLRPLAISLDNGFDTPLAQRNVKNIVKKLGLKWERCDFDNPAYHDLQVSFLKASVINAEAPTDHLITALLYRIARRERVRWIITGGNVVTEGIMPKAWGYDAKDWRHIKAIQKKFGKYCIDDFPHLTLWHWCWFTFISRIKFFPILNWIPYNREKARQELEQLDWIDYEKKHFESVYTRFYQAYILPKKFGIDKRRAHLSTLINSGQLSRQEALRELEEPYYPKEDQERDKEIICRKLGISIASFEGFMEQEVKDFRSYGSNERWFRLFKGFVGFARRVAIAN